MEDYLNEILVFDMLKTNVENSLKIYDNVWFTLDAMVYYLEDITSELAQNNLLNNMIIDKVHFYYNKLINSGTSRINTVESYNRIKVLINNSILDNNNIVFLCDIMQREFDIYTPLKFKLCERKAKNFYVNNYKEFMNDIAFDYYILNYLNNYDVDVDNRILYSNNFLKSLKYIVSISKEKIDYPFYLRVKSLLEYRDSALYNLADKYEHKQIIKRMGKKYE